MTVFTVRMTEENGHPVAWIDRDGSICIKQPHAPEQPNGSVWASREEAESWANAHAAELEAIDLAITAKAESDAALKASAKAKLVAGQPLTEEEAAVIVL